MVCLDRSSEKVGQKNTMDVKIERILVHVSVKEIGTVRGSNTYTAKKKATWHKHKRQHLRRFLLLALAVSKSLTHITVSRLLIQHPAFSHYYRYYPIQRRSRNFVPIFYLVLSGITTWPALYHVTFRVVFVGDTVTMQKTDISDSIVEIELLRILQLQSRQL